MTTTTEPRSAQSQFRVAGLVAKAAKRFMWSINPPITFGKQSSSPSLGSPRLTGETEHQRRSSATHKKKTHEILFSPLMPIKNKE